MKESISPTLGRLKTKEELQAQIENFAETKLATNYDENNTTDFYKNRVKTRSVLQNSSELASITNLDKIRDDLSEEIKGMVVANKDAYIESLKGNSGKKLKFQTECIERYNKEFEPIIQNLRSKLSVITTGKELQNIEGYIASGFEAHAFKIQTPSGVYVAKLFKNGAISEQQLEAMRRAKDMNNVSHLLSYSQKDQAVVMDFLEGEKLKCIKKEDKPCITDNEIVSILNTFISLYKMDIRLDSCGDNLMFDKEKGFSVFDYHSKTVPYSLFDALKDLSQSLACRENFSYGQEYEIETKKINSRMIQELKTSFPELYNEHKKEFEKSKFDRIKQRVKQVFE